MGVRRAKYSSDNLYVAFSVAFARLFSFFHYYPLSIWKSPEAKSYTRASNAIAGIDSNFNKNEAFLLDCSLYSPVLDFIFYVFLVTMTAFFSAYFAYCDGAMYYNSL